MSLADGMAWEGEFGYMDNDPWGYTRLVKRIGNTGGIFTNGKIYNARTNDGLIFTIINDRYEEVNITIEYGLWVEVTAESLIKAAHEEHLSKKGNKIVSGHSAEALRLATVKPLTDPLADKSTKPTKSDGGSSAYYELNLLIPAENVVKVDGQDFYRVKIETGDVIRGMVDNDFDLGNIIKACRRMHLAKKGMGKVGTTPEYDCKKIGYFRDEWYRNYCMEQI